MEVRIEGLEEVLRRIVREELAAVQPGGPSGWLTSKEAADYLGTSVPHVHNLVSAGKLPRHGQKGHGLRFTRADLDAYAGSRT